MKNEKYLKILGHKPTSIIIYQYPCIFTLRRLLLIQRMKNGLAMLSATIRLCSECWNWAPTVCAFFTFLWTTTILSDRFDAWTRGSRSCDDDALTEVETETAELSDEVLWPSLPARILTVSRLRQFFEDGRPLRDFDRFFRTLSPLSLLDKLSLSDWFSELK